MARTTSSSNRPRTFAALVRETAKTNLFVLEIAFRMRNTSKEFYDVWMSYLQYVIQTRRWSLNCTDFACTTHCT